jgi:hypothetical protein
MLFVHVKHLNILILATGVTQCRLYMLDRMNDSVYCTVSYCYLSNACAGPSYRKNALYIHIIVYTQPK